VVGWAQKAQARAAIVAGARTVIAAVGAGGVGPLHDQDHPIPRQSKLKENLFRMARDRTRRRMPSPSITAWFEVNL
jgi:hypothetical protein